MHNLREKSRWREQLAFEYKACLQKRRRVYLTLLLLPGVCKSHQSSAPARRRPPNCDPRLATAKWWPNSLPPAAHSSFCLIHVPLITIIIHNHGRTFAVCFDLQYFAQIDINIFQSKFHSSRRPSDPCTTPPQQPSHGVCVQAKIFERSKNISNQTIIFAGQPNRRPQRPRLHRVQSGVHLRGHGGEKTNLYN